MRWVVWFSKISCFQFCFNFLLHKHTANDKTTICNAPKVYVTCVMSHDKRSKLQILSDMYYVTWHDKSLSVKYQVISIKFQGPSINQQMSAFILALRTKAQPSFVWSNIHSLQPYEMNKKASSRSLNITPSVISSLLFYFRQTSVIFCYLLAAHSSKLLKYFARTKTQNLMQSLIRNLTNLMKFIKSLIKK